MSAAQVIAIHGAFVRKVTHNGMQNVFQLEKAGQIIAQSFSSANIALLCDCLDAGTMLLNDIPPHFLNDLSAPQTIDGNTALNIEPIAPNYSGRATRIDIEEELQAIERGECPLCRLTARHPEDTDCHQGHDINHMWDNRGVGCNRCFQDIIPGWLKKNNKWMRCPQCHPLHDGQYLSIENEPIIRDSRRGRWEYVRHNKTGDRRYLHMNCDVLTDNSGHCIMCGAPCPTLWTEGGLSI